MPRFETDTAGVITTPGRYQGRHIDDVMDYLEGLEAAVNNPDPNRNAPAGDPPPPAPTAAERLAASTRNRIDPLQAATMQRLEMDDEEAFSRETPDYSKYKVKIDQIKNTLHPVQRSSKNLHRTLYIQVKSEDPEVLARIRSAGEEPPPVPGEPVPPPPSPVVEVPVPPAPARVATFVPRPAPPMAAPTPGARAVPPAAPRVAKLVATDKIRQFCKATGRDVNEYLLRLEEQGTTQETLETGGQQGVRRAPTSVYDRKRAPR